MQVCFAEAGQCCYKPTFVCPRCCPQDDEGSRHQSTYPAPARKGRRHVFMGAERSGHVGRVGRCEIPIPKQALPQTLPYCCKGGAMSSRFARGLAYRQRLTWMSLWQTPQTAPHLRHCLAVLCAVSPLNATRCHWDGRKAAMRLPACKGIAKTAGQGAEP